MTTSALARDLAALVGTGNVLSPAPREYLTEASGHPSGPADAVVLPGTADEAAAVVAWCYERDVAMVPRGGGTGTNGQSLTDGLVVDVSRHMNRILEIDVAERWARVESGRAMSGRTGISRIEAAVAPQSVVPRLAYCICDSRAPAT